MKFIDMVADFTQVELMTLTEPGKEDTMLAQPLNSI